MVSNPRFSTFQQLTPSATAFHAMPGAIDESAAPRAPGGLAGMNQFAVMRDESQSRQRVTVHFAAGAPTLHMRFSALDMPSPTTIVESIKPGGISGRRTSSYYPNSVMTRDNYIPELPSRSRTPIYARHTRAYSDFSLRSASDSINALRELATQFPGLPPRVTGFAKPPPWDDPYDGGAALDRTNSSVSRVSDLSASSSLSRRKPVPRLSGTIDPFNDAVEEENNIAHTSLPLSVGVDRTSEYVPHDSANLGYKIGLSPTTSISETPVTTASGYSQATVTPQSNLTTPANESHNQVLTSLHKSQDLGQRVMAKRDGSLDLATVQELESLPTAKLDDTINKLKETVPTSRIKSIGKAPKRFTPTPVKTGLTRGSIYIEPIMIPPKQFGMPVVIQDGNVSSSLSGTLRNSQVLGIEEDDLFVRAR